MDTAEKIQILTTNKGSSVTVTRNGDEEISALIMEVNVDGEHTTFTFMDVMEGVERSLSVSEVSDITTD